MGIALHLHSPHPCWPSARRRKPRQRELFTQAPGPRLRLSAGWRKTRAASAGRGLMQGVLPVGWSPCAGGQPPALCHQELKVERARLRADCLCPVPEPALPQAEGELRSLSPDEINEGKADGKIDEVSGGESAGLLMQRAPCRVCKPRALPGPRWGPSQPGFSHVCQEGQSPGCQLSLSPTRNEMGSPDI